MLGGLNNLYETINTSHKFNIILVGAMIPSADQMSPPFVFESFFVKSCPMKL